MTASSAFYTDRYELTMLDAALRDEVAGRRVTFEVFSRHLPTGGRYGVFCGLGRLLDAVERFRFDGRDLNWLRQQGFLNDATLEWLEAYRFSGDIVAYREGELYGAGSPVLTVDGAFGEAVLLETLVLSILNHDSAVASAGSRIVAAAGGRPVIEMGSRRTDPEAAVAAARAAYLVGFASSSNLEAGRRYGVPTAGTAAHAFSMLYDGEEEAFRAQVAALGPGTTLLVDTYDTMAGVRHAVAAAGPLLGAVRIDSGDLAAEAVEVRRLLDELGATGTQVLLTGDLGERELAALASVPADGYGVGTAVVMGGGQPTAGFVYKLVAVGGDRSEGDEAMRPVAKQSPGKVGVAGRKWAWRLLGAEGRESVGAVSPVGEETATTDEPPTVPNRGLQIPVIRGGQVVHRPPLEEIRAYHAHVREEWPVDRILQVSRRI